ncbi:MAG: hypothetical protein ACKN9V_06000 [Pseudomonadota bacterium]
MAKRIVLIIFFFGLSQSGIGERIPTVKSITPPAAASDQTVELLGQNLELISSARIGGKNAILTSLGKQRFLTVPQGLKRGNSSISVNGVVQSAVLKFEPLCDTEKIVSEENSSLNLAINASSVVTDPNATFKLNDLANSRWSFPYLMGRIAGIDPKDPNNFEIETAQFIERWAQTFQSVGTINGHNFGGRNFFAIVNWPRKEVNNISILDLEKSPMKLLAILYRPDLAQPNKQQAGEGRFVYEVKVETAANGISGAHESPFNVILEYGLPLNETNSSATWVKRWADLSSLALGTSVGFYEPSLSKFHLKNSLTGGNIDNVFQFGSANSNWIPLVGDWDNDGKDAIGLYDPVNSQFHLKNSLAGGNADINVFQFGSKHSGWTPLSGDWDGDGKDTIGLYDPIKSQFHLKNAFAGGNPDSFFQFGPANSKWIPLVGDWNGDGKDTIGLYDPINSQFHLKNSLAGGNADIEIFQFGSKNSGWTPLSGDWDNDGKDTIGLYDPIKSQFHLRNSFSGGNADILFELAVSPKAIPFVGTFGGTFGNLYNFELRKVTDSFTDQRFSGRLNGSAINQVRTNEIALGSPWQLREWKLISTDGSPVNVQLVPDTVKDTPKPNLNETERTALIDWWLNQSCSGDETPLRNCNDVIPSRFLAGAANTPGISFNIPGAPQPPSQLNKFDLMTCNGCHAPKVTRFEGGLFTPFTPFTHVNRVGFSPFLKDDLVQRRARFRDALLENFCK